jgi:hypothetical protein
MHSGHARRAGVWHYKKLELGLLDDLRAGRVVLIFDLTNEGPPFDSEIFDELLSWIESERFPAGRVVWVAQNRVAKASFERHAVSCTGLIRFEHYDFFAKIMAWIFSPKSPAPVLGVDAEAAIAQMFDLDGKDRLLLCLNATPRAHRVLAIAALIHHDLMDSSLVSFPGLAYAKDPTNERRVFDFVARHPRLGYMIPSLRKAMMLRDLKADDVTCTGNALFDKVDAIPYRRTFFSLITETEMSDGTVRRVTEKTVKAFCLGHPTLVLGNPGAVSFLTEWGFQDWDGVLDRSMETEADPSIRFNEVMREVVRQAWSVQRNPMGWLNRVMEIGATNIRHAVSGRFLDTYSRIYDDAIIQRLCAILG